MEKQSLEQHKVLYDEHGYKRFLTKRELRDELFGILSMCNGFLKVGHVGGERQKEMKKALPHQIAIRIIKLQDLINDCTLEQ